MAEPKTLSKKRIASIDALRGFDMFWIVGGGTIFYNLYDVWPNAFTKTIQTQLEHVTWAGFRFEDLIFPLFLFIVGLVLPLSNQKRLSSGQSKSQLYIHIIKRTLLLFLIGLIYNGLLKFDFENMRWTGVLQRIAICYFFASIIVINTKFKSQAFIIAVLLIGYWLASAYIPVPGYGAGDFSAEGCLSSWVDQNFLPGKLYYGFGDNEGLISNITAVATTLIGCLAGQFLTSDRDQNKKTIVLVIAAMFSLALGYIWATFFPIIKNIWTSSFVLVAAGYSLLLLAAFYYIIDVKNYKKWSFFFIVIGANAIFIYFTTDFVNYPGIAEYFLAGTLEIAKPYAPLILPIGALAVEWLLLYIFYKNKIFIKL